MTGSFRPLGKTCVRYSLMAVSVVLHIFPLSESQVSAQTNTTLTRLRLSNGTVMCAVDKPSLTVPIPTETSDSCVPDAVYCARVCRQNANCTSFNYNAFLGCCELYYYRPLNYAPTANCSHYRSIVFDGYCQSDQVVITATRPASARKMIPAECCGYPFTYNGKLYRGCAQNASNPEDMGCLLRNRTWVSCLPPASYISPYSLLNITIPTFNGTTPVLSVNNWLIILHRFDGSVSFNGGWQYYKAGFGNATGEYWLGLERIHQLTSNATYRMRIEMQTYDTGGWYSAEYESFVIGPEKKTNKGYAIQVTGYCGDSGDGLSSPTVVSTSYQNGMDFSTPDADNDLSGSINCITYYGLGSFWFNACCYSCLTATWGSSYYYWHPLQDLQVSKVGQLKISRMMIKLTSSS